MLQIDGFYKVGKIIQLFLALEYAFTVKWPARELIVAHHKGTWELVKKDKGEVVDKLSVSDDGNFTSDNSLLMGLAETKANMGKLPGHEVFINTESGDREVCSRVIVEVLEIWLGHFDEIKSISCVQPGRNALIDDQGNFCLGPSPLEWKR